MGTRLLAAVTTVALSTMFVGACTRPGPGSTTTTKAPPVSVTLDRWVVTGQTLNIQCGGIFSGNTCQAPKPASVTVTTREGNRVVAEVVSDDNGNFVLALPSGTYTIQASSP